MRLARSLSPRLLRTSTFRLTLLYSGVFALSAATLFGAVIWLATTFMARQIDMTVANELTEIEADAGGEDGARLQQVIEEMTARSPGIYYLLQDAHGTVLAGNMPAVDPVPGVRVLSSKAMPFRDVASGGIRGCGKRLPDGGYLFVGLSDFEVGAMQQAVARAFLWGFAATVVLALAGGLAISLGVQRRIDAISRASRDIMAGDLKRRMALSGSDDEFDRLAGSLNAMLDRIEELMQGVVQVSTDIAHDLRTPLTRLRQRLELACRRERTVDGLCAALEASIRDTDAILDTFAALLRIAQIESGTRKAGFAEVALSPLLEGLAETFQPLAEERGQALWSRIVPGLHIQGDRELLTQLFANLIDNAIGHTPPGTRLGIAASAEGNAVRVVVCDTGPGIPAKFRRKVLQRFFRLDASRGTPGSGLGLSLVAAIANLHGASLELEDNAPGLRCIVSFPHDRAR